MSIKSLDPQQRHDYILKTFILNKTKVADSKHKRDIDVIRENHKFLWDDDDVPDSWEARLAKKYYDKLFKEYCLGDLTRYKENKIALRWRTEQEVVSGKGQFICGNRKCTSKERLCSWEVNFAYVEKGQKMNALIKLRLCPDCTKMLNYNYSKHDTKKPKRLEKQKSSKKTSKHRTSSEGAEGQMEITTRDGRTEMEIDNSSKADGPSTAQPNEEEIVNIWNKIEIDVETVDREEEFEKYLEDLLM